MLHFLTYRQVPASLGFPGLPWASLGFRTCMGQVQDLEAGKAVP